MRALFPVMLWFSVMGGAETAEAASSDEEILRERVMLVGNALASGDVKTAERLLAADYRHTDWRGQVDERSSFLRYARQRPKREMDFRDVQVRLYGDMAVVTGEHKGMDPRTGDDLGPQLRFMQLWMKDGGEWKLAASQATRVAR